MRGLAGATHRESLKHLDYGYQYSYIDVQSLDGVPRTALQLDIKVTPTISKLDEILLKGIEYIKNNM